MTGPGKRILAGAAIVAAMACVVSFGTGTGDGGTADDDVFLGEVDLAERAEIWRNQYRRMTPGDEPLVQDVGAWPAAWEEFGSHWGAAPATRDLATWLVPFSAERTNNATVIRDANGTVLWSGTTDFAKDESANVTLTGALVDEADWPLYDAAQWEVLRRTGASRSGFRDGEGGGTNNTPTNNPSNMFVSAFSVFTNGFPELHVGLQWTNDITLDIFSYAPVCSFETHEYVVTNDENAVVTNTGTSWHAPLPGLTGLNRKWKYVGTISLTNGEEAVFVDNHYVHERWPVRFYAAFEAGDFDGDGLNDLFEKEALGTSTNNVDHDNDGINDGFEQRCGADPARSNVWWTCSTTNIWEPWVQFIGCSNSWGTNWNFIDSFQWSIDKPAAGSVLHHAWLSGWVDDAIKIDGNELRWEPDVKEFINEDIATLIKDIDNGVIRVDLFDWPKSGHTGCNEARLGTTTNPFRITWDWSVPLDVRLEPVWSSDTLPFDNPSGIIQGSNAWFHVDVLPEGLVPETNILWEVQGTNLVLMPTNRGSRVQVHAQTLGDDELHVTVEGTQGSFNLPPFHVKVVPLTVVTAKVGVVLSTNGMWAMDSTSITQTFNKANAILAQSGLQLEIAPPIVPIPYVEEYWDVNFQIGNSVNIWTNIPAFGGIRVFFDNTITMPNGSRGAGVNDIQRTLIANVTASDHGRALAHEVGHASGLRDLYPKVTEHGLVATGPVSPERMPADWGSYGLVNDEEKPVEYMMQRLLMHWSPVNNDIPSGEVYGVWYEWTDGTNQTWHLTNAPVGLSGMTNVPSHRDQ